MTRIWQTKLAALDAAADDFNRRAAALRLLDREYTEDEWRTTWLVLSATLAKRLDGTICLAGPIVLGIRYRASYVSQAPHPWEIVTVLQPRRVFGPNTAPSGAMCLGHPEAGVSLEYILNQAWAGLTFNMRTVNTRRGDILNAEAAQFVRANAERFPLTEKGIFEEPDFDAPSLPAGPFGMPMEHLH